MGPYHQRCRCNQHLYCPMASIPPKARKPFLRRISHRRWIRHVCLPLQTKRRSHRCHGNHLQWNSNMMDYDYSILTLSSQVDVTDPDVAIIPIAAKEYPGGMDAIITGWGMTNPNINRLPTQLQLAETNLVSAEDCKAYWGPRRITDRMQCIGGNSINSGCMGDSGGPLVVTDPDDGITYLVGNTSFGTSDCSTSAPGMWSKNVVVKDWIDSFISA